MKEDSHINFERAHLNTAVLRKNLAMVGAFMFPLPLSRSKVQGQIIECTIYLYFFVEASFKLLKNLIYVYLMCLTFY